MIVTVLRKIIERCVLHMEESKTRNNAGYDEKQNGYNSGDYKFHNGESSLFVILIVNTHF